jgi:hypothetical protein
MRLSFFFEDGGMQAGALPGGVAITGLLPVTPFTSK